MRFIGNPVTTMTLSWDGNVIGVAFLIPCIDMINNCEASAFAMDMDGTECRNMQVDAECAAYPAIVYRYLSYRHECA